MNNALICHPIPPSPTFSDSSHYIDPGQLSGKQSAGLFSDPPHTQQNGLIESFNGSLRDECLNEEIFDSLADARQKLALWRYDYNKVRPHSSLGNQTPVRARRALEQSDANAPGALAQPETDAIDVAPKFYPT